MLECFVTDGHSNFKGPVRNYSKGHGKKYDETLVDGYQGLSKGMCNFKFMLTMSGIIELKRKV